MMPDSIGITARPSAFIHLSIPCHPHEDCVLVCRISEIIFCTSILSAFSVLQIRSHGSEQMTASKTENSGINVVKTAHPLDQCPIAAFLHPRLRWFAGNWAMGLHIWHLELRHPVVCCITARVHNSTVLNQSSSIVHHSTVISVP